MVFHVEGPPAASSDSVDGSFPHVGSRSSDFVESSDFERSMDSGNVLREHVVQAKL
jgi:hypothetical protein